MFFLMVYQIPEASMQSLWSAIGSGSFDVLSEAVKAIVYEGSLDLCMTRINTGLS